MNSLSPRPVITSTTAQEHLFGARQTMDEALKGMDTQRQIRNQMAHNEFQLAETRRVADEQNQLKITLQNVKKML